MKLLLVTPYFYPKTGGLENYAYNIAKGLQQKFNWEVVVVTSNHSGKTNSKEQLEGITVYRMVPWINISNTPINPFWYFSIKKIIKEENPDVINAHAPVPFIADIASFASGKTPFVLTYHAGSMKKDSLFFDILISFYEKIFLQNLMKRANKIICSSEFVKNSTAQKYSAKSLVISPAVDTTIFKPSSTKREKATILFIGRYSNVYSLKGFYYLLTAVKSLPKVTIKVIGEKIALEQKNIHFLGIKNKAIEIAKEMQKASLLVLPSIAPMESFGMVLIEAMACKTPVIGTYMGGIPGIISNKETGLLVPAKDSEALRKAIKTLIGKKDIARKMGNNGYLSIQKKYLWKFKVDQTNKVLKSISTSL